ncbi:hypothetical protein PRV_01990 [Mycoplasma parvum str. Indiana]|uniref:Uncharacterized protein n=1 Tax=Mycoplasma parvum str. Indiana TaxID=1403316 RepID=U5NC33_9MOLU|nr:hypothetical protein PRV_01990 [Mycoplasma parvum str. Indiana]
MLFLKKISKMSPLFTNSRWFRKRALSKTVLFKISSEILNHFP